ncbi:MAG: LAGLIDADG family homing endonuclease [Candidatus Thorarchaeota archaeon]|jgi:hypothetical protein
MMGEGGERRRRSREGQDESESNEDVERRMRELIHEARRELDREEEDGRESFEDPEESVKRAVREIEQEEEERRRENEEYQRRIQEKEDGRERARQEREESADKDALDDFEKKELEKMKERGEDPEDVLRRWREQYVKEVGDRLGETPESREKDDEQEDVGADSENQADDLSYFGDGTGQMYATKSEHRENVDGELESALEKDTQPKELDNERESENPKETDSRPEERESTSPDTDEDLDSEPETSTKRESDESPRQKRTRREMVAEGEAEREMGDNAEPEPSEKDSKKEFYKRPEEEWRRKYREQFEEREEEEKEEFREVLVDQVKEKEDVEKLARKNDYESLLEDEEAMEEIEEYLQTRKALENAEEEEIEELAKELGVDPELLKDGDLSEILPESLKELLNREGDLLWRELERRFIESFFPESSKELRMISDDEGGHLSEDDEKLKEEAEAWIEIMAIRNRGELDFKVIDGREWYDSEQIKELSEQHDIDEEKIASWLRLEDLPPLIEERLVSRIREIYRNFEGSVTDETDESGPETAELETPESETSESQYPVIMGKRIESVSQFLRIIREEFPWMLERSDSDELLQYIRAFYEAKEIEQRTGPLNYSQIREIADRYEISHESVRSYVRSNTRPMAFDMLNRGLSLSDARRLIKKLIRQLNGIENWTDCQSRLESFYLFEDLKGLRSYKKDVESARQFFRYLEALKQGGLLTDIARRAGLSVEKAKSFRHHKSLPRLIGIASAIPQASPSRGHKWLPKKIRGYTGLSDFIEVLSKIRSLSDIEGILRKLHRKSSREMKSWKAIFRPLPQLVALMYFLGALASDGSVGRKEGISTRVGISLSKKYSWSKDFGEFFSYCLGILGISAKQVADSKSRSKSGEPIVKSIWISEHSPLLVWFLRAALGLDRKTAKSKQSVDVEWVLSMPEEARLAFLQGLADGDGYASIKNMNAGIATKTNQDFVQKLLRSFGIESSKYPNKVQFHMKEHLERAQKLPLFRTADGRQKRLKMIIDMINSLSREHVSEEERGLILDWHKKGYSAGDISILLWQELRRARRTPTIYKVIRDHKSGPT